MSRLQRSFPMTSVSPSGTADRDRVRSRRAVLATLAAVPVVWSLSGCFGGGARRATPTPTATVREPTDTDLEDFRRRIRALPHVTGATLTYTKGTFGNGPLSEAHITSDATDQATLNDTLDQTYRMVWASRIGMGAMNYTVTNPATGAYANSDTLGLRPGPGLPELTDHYGSPPGQGGSAPSPSPSPST